MSGAVSVMRPARPGRGSRALRPKQPGTNTPGARRALTRDEQAEGGEQAGGDGLHEIGHDDGAAAPRVDDDRQQAHRDSDEYPYRKRQCGQPRSSARGQEGEDRPRAEPEEDVTQCRCSRRRALRSCSRHAHHRDDRVRPPVEHLPTWLS